MSDAATRTARRRCSRSVRRGVMPAVVATALALVACSQLTGSTEATSSAMPPTPAPAPAQPPPAASDPAGLADSLVAAEQTLADPASSQDALTEAAHRQQVAYRAIGFHPEWDVIARPRIPPERLDVYDRNINARRGLAALVADDPKTSLPAWRINPPAPADELLGYYHDAEAATGVGWNYLAAINMVETAFGRIAGTSDAGAQGPMQFLPATFAAYGDGGDIHSPRDAILAAGRMLSADGFATNPHGAIFSYNHSNLYVRSVDNYAAVLAADPAAFTGYYRWDVYYHTTSGDVLLPVGYVATERIPVADYLAQHPR